MNDATAPVELSIITSSYNDGTLSLDCARSLLEQTGELPAYEWIFVDDGSTDPLSKETIDGLPALDPRIRLFRFEKNRGISPARNYGAGQARGEWLIFLDADDEWFPDSLHRVWQALKSNPEHRWFGANWGRWRDGRLLDPAGAALTRDCFTSEVLRNAYRGEDSITRLERPVEAAIHGGVTIPSSCFIRTEVFREAGGFDESLRYAEDFLLYIRLAKDYDFYFTPTLFHRYRQWHKPDRGRMGGERYWTARALRYIKSDPAYREHIALINREIVIYLRDEVYYHRKGKRTLASLLAAMDLLRANPLDQVGWKSIPAALLRR